VVDDSVVVRRLLTDILSAEPDMEVITAASASLALAKLEQVVPDIITLDVELPDMNGLELLEEIRRRSRKTPVIMFSSLTQKAAATTLDALARGAADYVAKPAGGTREASTELVRSQLVPKIRALLPRFPTSSGTMKAAAPVAATPIKRALSEAPAAGIGIIAIGCSTGGPNALAELFQSVPANLDVPIVIVQHMPPLFTRLLAERLTTCCAPTFTEASAGDVIEPGRVYIAPGDHHMRVVREGVRMRLALDQGPPENSCRPAVDVLFRSVAELFAERTLALVLTGMGQDGLRGVEQIRARGGRVLVQDEASSVVWGMPGFIAKAGLANAILPIPELASQMIRYGRRSVAGKESHVG
jgi:two-component system chemotaxis response regulator CheB